MPQDSRGSNNSMNKIFVILEANHNSITIPVKRCLGRASIQHCFCFVSQLECRVAEMNCEVGKWRCEDLTLCWLT